MKGNISKMCVLLCILSTAPWATWVKFVFLYVLPCTIISVIIWPIYDICWTSRLSIWLLRSNSPSFPIIFFTYENTLESRMLDWSSKEDNNTDISRYSLVLKTFSSMARWKFIRYWALLQIRIISRNWKPRAAAESRRAKRYRSELIPLASVETYTRMLYLAFGLSTF
jgi:hypothetical protein